MDFELEMAFLVGTGCQLGESIDVNNAQGIIYQCSRSNSIGFQGLISYKLYGYGLKCRIPSHVG